MNERMQQLVDFIDQYAEDYLEDGTKNSILEGLRGGNEKLALEIMGAMNRKWTERAKERGKFRIFRTSSNLGFNHNPEDIKPFYQISYMDDYYNPSDNKIPTLKYIVPREKYLSGRDEY